MLPRASGSGPWAAIFDQGVIERPICGILAGRDEYVRLTELQSNGARASSRGPSNENILADRCLLSRTPFSPDAELRFRSLRFSLQGYEEWLGLRSIKVAVGRRSLTARYVRSHQYKWKLSLGKLSLEFDLRHPIQGSWSKISLTELPHLRISVNQQVDLHKTLDLARRIEDLITLLTDSDRGLNFPYLEAIGHSSPIKIYYTRLEHPQEEVVQHKCWTWFPNISGNFGSIMEKWFSKHEFFGPGFHLYLGSRRRTQLYPEHRFASLVWGLESLHRRVSSAGESTALDEKIKRILSRD